MAILGIGDYLCEACKYFDTDGADGNHPNCWKQSIWERHHEAVPVGEDCRYGFKFGIPACYPVNKERNKERAYKIAEQLGLDTNV